VLQTEPLVLVDGAQNEASAARLAAGLGEFTAERVIMVVGLSVDKDAAAFAAALAPRAARVLAVRSGNSRSAPVEAVAAAFAAQGIAVEVAGPVPAGLDAGIAAARPHGTVCVTGSLFVVGEALAARGRCPGDFDAYVPPGPLPEASPAAERKEGP
jgi:dihydrofolate synthase/folylpolyglutamate synthase